MVDQLPVCELLIDWMMIWGMSSRKISAYVSITVIFFISSIRSLTTMDLRQSNQSKRLMNLPQTITKDIAYTGTQPQKHVIAIILIVPAPQKPLNVIITYMATKPQIIPLMSVNARAEFRRWILPKVYQFSTRQRISEISSPQNIRGIRIAINFCIEVLNIILVLY